MNTNEPVTIAKSGTRPTTAEVIAENILSQMDQFKMRTGNGTSMSPLRPSLADMRGFVEGALVVLEATTGRTLKEPVAPSYQDGLRLIIPAPMTPEVASAIWVSLSDRLGQKANPVTGVATPIPILDAEEWKLYRLLTARLLDCATSAGLAGIAR